MSLNADALAAMMRDKRVTFRTYGLHGERRRPMVHRFPVKGGVSVIHAMTENIYKASPLLKALMKKDAGA